MCRKMIKIKIVVICKCLSLPRQCKYHLFGSSFKEYTIVTNRQKYSTSMRKNFLLGTRRHPASQRIRHFLSFLGSLVPILTKKKSVNIKMSKAVNYSFCISTWHFIPKTAFTARHKFHFKAFSPQIIYHFINSSLARVSETWTSTYIKAP